MLHAELAQKILFGPSGISTHFLLRVAAAVLTIGRTGLLADLFCVVTVRALLQVGYGSLR